MVDALVPNLNDRPSFTGSLKAVGPLSSQSSIYLVHVHKWRLNLRLHYCALDFNRSTLWVTLSLGSTEL